MTYWLDRGKGYLGEFQRHGPITRYRFWKQERELIKAIPKDIDSVLEIGCGFGRITKLILKNFNVSRYVATDISHDQIENAKRYVNSDLVEFRLESVHDMDYNKEFDLVIASEVLMHLPPGEIRDAITIMENAAKKYCINVDWYAPGESNTAGGFCWQHDYKSLYSNGNMIKKLHRQGIFIACV